MDDRELLEMAAKACGMTPPWDKNDVFSAWAGEAETGHWWNPLVDDGDALRLARSLLMRIDFYTREVWYPVGGGRWQTIGWHLEAYKGAVVRAAAEIGRAM